MRKFQMKWLTGVTVAAVAATGLLACAPPEEERETTTNEEGVDVREVTSAEDFGGMEALVAAAEEEGELNVIALPRDWANYGAVIDAFKEKYDIEVNEDQPDADSATEIATAKRLKGTDRAPDVFDLGQAVALSSLDYFTPYQVETWGDIPEDFKHPEGLWVNDYGGYVSIGYDSAEVPQVSTLDDLLAPAFKGKVALNGDPTAAGAAFSGVVMASVANGGSADDIQPGIEYFTKLADAGNLIPVDPTPATIAAGQTPVVIDWDYNNAALVDEVPGWKVVVPEGAAISGYYYQAINVDAPHPAAARLWQEFLYSDEGQNLWLEGGARPIRAEAMVEAGTINEEAYSALPPVEGEPVVVSDEQTTAAAEILATEWPKVIG
jgi:putative spermidine/putrescine transport system substrate-binding protein